MASNISIIVERTYDTPIEKAWKAITDKDEMKKWYFDIKSFEPKPGFEFEFMGGDKEGVEYHHLCKVIEAIPNKKLSHSWRYKGYPGESKVTWDLKAEGNKTTVKLTHEGLETFPQEGAFARENFVEGWNYILSRSLEDYLASNQTNAFV